MNKPVCASDIIRRDVKLFLADADGIEEGELAG